MKIKVSEATPLQLDWLVAQCEGVDLSGKDRSAATNFLIGCKCQRKHRYSADWLLGGPIIERESIAVTPCEDMETWAADMQFRQGVETQYGSTPLIAALRCFVSSRLGDEVEVPEELT